MTQASVLARLPFSKHLLQLHRDVLGPNFPVGLTFAPRIAGTTGTEVAPPPYVVLIPYGSFGYSGPPFHSPDADATWVFQVTMVATTGTQLEWMRDKVVGLWLERNPDGSFVHDMGLAGYRVMDRRPTDDSNVEPMGRDEGLITVSTDLRFACDVTPTEVPVP